MTTSRVVAVGLAGLVLASAVVLLERGPRRSGSDLTPNGAFVAVLGKGQQACQGGELLPADTAALRMTIGTYGRPGPKLSVNVSGPRGEPLTTGAIQAGWRQGVVRIPVAHVSRTTGEARVCVRDDGSTSVALAGDFPDPGYTMQLDGRTVANMRVRVHYMRPGRESWLELLPTIVYRLALGKSDLVRRWAWAAVLVLMLASVVLALRTILAEGHALESDPTPGEESSPL